MSTKHGPNRLRRYQDIHQTIIDRFLGRGDFVLAENLEFSEYGDGYIMLEGQIDCASAIYITVRKQIRILSGDGPDALVQTTMYSYNAVLRNVGNILRYDSPHRGLPGPQPPHHDVHHVHRYDVLNGDQDGTVEHLTSEDEIPTLGEVIEIVRGWYYDHLDELTRRGLVGP